MKRQRVSTSLNTVLIVCTALLIMPKSAYAGSANITGSSDESSSFLNYNPGVELFLPDAPNVSINLNSGSLFVATEALKQEFGKIANTGEEVSTENDVIIDLIARKPEAGVAQVKFKTTLVELGAKEDAVDKLKAALSDLLPDCQSLQVSTCNYIDIKKLNRAILVHNDFVKTLSPEAFAKIQQHPYFKDWYAQLMRLRAAILQK
ncbi:MAG: hypothetical protein KME29_29820 [Calothrix sp. FI2-JRJ7]|jgi:hypothetical protein|nr:hypothetical protein [Calothrix sp. FI2-JRJ7]